MPADQGQAQAANLSVEDRILNIIDPPQEEEVPETEVEAEESTEVEKTEEPDADKEVKVDEEVPENEVEALDWDTVKDLKLEVSVQGEKAEVTLEEARLGYMRTSDYQKKTQELANQRKQVVEEATNVVQQVQETYTKELDNLQKAVEKLAMGELQNVDLNWLAESDPNAYIKYQHRINQYNQTLQSIKAEQENVRTQNEQKAQLQRSQMLQQGMEELKTRIPNFSKETEQKLIETGIEYGFSEDELRGITDPKVLHVLNDARQFRELNASKPKVLKKASEAPKVIKPGSKPAQKQDNKAQEFRERIKKTGGKDEDALLSFIKRTL